MVIENGFCFERTLNVFRAIRDGDENKNSAARQKF